MIMVSCAGTEKKKSSIAEISAEPSTQKEPDDAFYVSNQLKTVTVSRSNSRLTPYLVDKRKAEKTVRRLRSAVKGSKNPDRKNLVALMSAKRMAGSSLSEVLATAKQLVQLEIKTNPKRGLPGFAKLELVLSALQSKKYALAEYYLYELVASSNKPLKAAAYTVQGIIRMNDNRLPEAIGSWNEALKVDPSYRPALLNLGFVSLKYGDFEKAKQHLSKVKRTWFESYGLMVAERMTKGVDKASSLCRNVLNAKPRYKPAILSCALNEYQGSGNAKAAISHVDKLAKIPGNTNIDSIGYQLRKSIEAERSKDRSKAKAAKEPEVKNGKKPN